MYHWIRRRHEMDRWIRDRHERECPCCGGHYCPQTDYDVNGDGAGGCDDCEVPNCTEPCNCTIDEIRQATTT